MFRWVFKFVLLRFLPRRLLPILTIVELVRLARGLRRSGHAVNEPTQSRTAKPPPISPPDAETGTPQAAEPGPTA
jgi:hypothetical protein